MRYLVSAMLCCSRRHSFAAAVRRAWDFAAFRPPYLAGFVSVVSFVWIAWSVGGYRRPSCARYRGRHRCPGVPHHRCRSACLRTMIRAGHKQVHRMYI